MVSTILSSPILVPSRRCAACGAWLMLSWPPTTMIEASPLRIACQPTAPAPRPRAAELVDAERGLLDGDTRIHGGLAGRVLALPGTQDLAHDDFVDFLGLDLGAVERALDRGLA